ncbi:hypothetical protein NCCP2716_27370 [Sporosarcina sp. NCCP-2716]|nr:hypothetical protein [Sporosarcina sp. NCCP-2716]GKV70239.1 hypothetical protein NCCP2716_27370 [Sporosarcina sp. NCCP-2716]
MIDPVTEHIMLTGYPSRDYLDYERQQEEQLDHGPYDSFNDFFIEEEAE